MISWVLFGFIMAVSVSACILAVKGFGLLKIRRLNSSRLRDLRLQRSTTINPVEQLAIDAVIRKCGAGRWVLQESDLRVLSGTRKLVEEIAAIYHPQSSFPVAEARVGRLLQAFLELRDNITVLTRMKGVRAMTQFRFRHIAHFSRIWKKKEEWRQSSVARALIRFKAYTLSKWVYYLLQFTDLSFWSMRAASYFFYDVVFNTFLVRWYLMVGDLALKVYREQEKEPEIHAERIFDELESLVELEGFREEGLPDGVLRIVEASRKKILFDPWTLKWHEVKDIYFRLVEDIARFHHPGSGKYPAENPIFWGGNLDQKESREQPLDEAKLFDVLEGLARFAETLSALRTKPILNKLLDIRVAHILRIKDTTETILDNPLMGWVKKYRLHKAVKFSSMILMAIVKRHPGVIFQQFAFSVVTEGGKRWIYLYIHDKVAVEANNIYRKKQEQ